MPCIPFRVGEASGFICVRGRQARHNCKYCSRPATLLCDWPLTGEKAGQTCDTHMCRNCALHREPDKDYCRPHAKMIIEREPKQMEIGDEAAGG